MIEPVKCGSGFGLNRDSGLREDRVTSEGNVAHVDHERHDPGTSKQLRAAFQVSYEENNSYNIDFFLTF